MAEKNEQNQSTQDKMEELFALMDEKAAAGELDESAEPAPEEVDTTPFSESETAAYEYAMMMRQYEAMLEDYMRREAEEKAQKEAEAAERSEEQPAEEG